MKIRLLTLTLALAALVAAPAFAAGTWEDTATVQRIEGAITEHGTVLTRVLLQSGDETYAATCNADPREIPQVCENLMVGTTYELVGHFSAGPRGVELRVLEALPILVVE